MPRITRTGAPTAAENRSGILFALPAILGFLVFILLPMVASLVLSFTDYRIVNETSFIGFHHYRDLFSGEDRFFYKSLGVTFYYVLLSVPGRLVFAFAVALLMNQPIRGKSVFRTIFYIPTIVPIVATSMIWLWLLNPDLGLVNVMLRGLGLPTSQWIFSESAVIPSLALMSIWRTGEMMVIFLAGLQGIPRQLYEAVDVDGGNAFHKLFRVTIPMMTPTIFFNAVISLIIGFQTFSEPFIMTGGGPNDASLFYVLYLYRVGFEYSEMGRASAIAWVLFLIMMFFTALLFLSSSRWVYYEGKRQ